MSTAIAAVAELDATLDDEPPVREPDVGHRWLTLIVATALTLMIVGPLIVALVGMHSPRWYPSLENAQAELHVRNVGTSQTPLTGLIGRLGESEERGSHPGPLSFYALAPVYRLAGSSPWALQVATVVLHLAAVVVALFIGYRRGGVWLMALTATTLAVLLRFYGAGTITEPWNPYLPLVWWVVFILAVWSVVEDDLPMLPVAVAAGCLCIQTHISYVGLVGGLTAWAVAAVLVRAVRRRTEGRALARPLAWLALSAVGGALLWIPPVVDEIRHERGNLSLLVDYFTSGSNEDPIGFGQGTQMLVASIDPWRLVTDHAVAKSIDETPSWSVAALLFLTAWALTAVAAWRIRRWPLVRLHATIGIVLVLGVLQTSRIFGFAWQWLVLWAWGVGALMMLAMAWTVGALVGRRPTVPRPGGTARPVRLLGIGALTVVSLGAAVAQTTDAATVEPDDPTSSRALRHLVPEVVDAIDEGGTGKPAGRYLVTWTDPIGVVGDLQGFGLVNELDRRGIPVGLEENRRLRASPHLTTERKDAVAMLHLATGRAADEWKAKPGARLIAEFDPRTAAERARQDRLRDELREALRDLGRPELIDLFDSAFIGLIFVLREDPETPERVVDLMMEILDLGTPSSVFLVR